MNDIQAFWITFEKKEHLLKNGVAVIETEQNKRLFLFRNE